MTLLRSERNVDGTDGAAVLANGIRYSNSKVTFVMSGCMGRALAGGSVQKSRFLHGNAVYDVKTGAQLHSWRALPLPSSPMTTSLTVSAAESRSVRALRHPHILRHLRTLLAPEADALYIITEPIPQRTLSQLLQRAVDESLVFDEGFLWSALHQLASVCKALQNVRLQFFEKRFHPDHVYLDADNKIKVDPFCVPTLEKITGSSFSSCVNDICTVGALIHHLATKTKQPLDSFGCLLNELLHPSRSSDKCDILPDIILHHPMVLFNMNNSCDVLIRAPDQVKPTNDSAFESDESSLKFDFSLPRSPDADTESLNITENKLEISDLNLSDRIKSKIDDTHLSPTIMALDLKIPGYVPRKSVNRWNSRTELDKEPKDVSEETLNKVWIERLADLRKREEALKMKEKEIAMKDLFDKIKAEILPVEEPKKFEANDESFDGMTGITLQSVMTEKNFPIFSNGDKTESFVEDKIAFYENGTACKRSRPRSRSSTSRGSHKSNSMRKNKRRARPYEDMDSSLSADPGDTSILPTSTKLSAEVVPRPVGIENLARRKVHFNRRNNPFAEYESVCSTTMTYFDKANLDTSYEIPKQFPPSRNESINDTIAKFSYFDLEAITKEKRAQMDEWRKTPPKPKPALKTPLQSTNDSVLNNKPTAKKSRKQKYSSPKMGIYSSLSFLNHNSSQSESSYKSVKSLPCISSSDNKRKSTTNLNKDETRPTRNVLGQFERMNTRASFYCSKLRSNLSNTIKNNENDKPTNKQVSTKITSDVTENKENLLTCTPGNTKKRRSILGFKTPFSFKF